MRKLVCNCPLHGHIQCVYMRVGLLVLILAMFCTRSPPCLCLLSLSPHPLPVSINEKFVEMWGSLVWTHARTRTESLTSWCSRDSLTFASALLWYEGRLRSKSLFCYVSSKIFRFWWLFLNTNCTTSYWSQLTNGEAGFDPIRACWRWFALTTST